MYRFFAWFFALLILLVSAGLWYGVSTGVLVVKWGEAPPVVAIAPLHPLAGAWQAKDKTVFIFRPDGTMVGRDVRDREIWGAWVRLDERRVGFQSLRHDGFYNPQYAVIRDADTMDYIVTNGTHFISAVRIPLSFAEAEISKVRAATVVWPTAHVEEP